MDFHVNRRTAPEPAATTTRRPRTRRYLARSTTLLMAMLAVLMLTTVSPAQADPLPLGTFKIAVQGNCVDKAPSGKTALVTACNLTNLTQQFIYIPVTQQIRSVANPTTCLTAALGGIPRANQYYLIFDPCTISGTSHQRFWRTGPNSSGQYVINMPPFIAAERIPYCLQADSLVMLNRPCSRPEEAPPNQLFTFPIV